ncbi:MAG: aminotransferase class V-fold PLP-dependent enzyme [Thiobacillus sp.]
MFGPEGPALFCVRPGIRNQFRLNQYGWHMVEDALDFARDDWRVTVSARRFECGRPNTLGNRALSASLELLAEAGITTVAAQVVAHSAYLMDALAALPGIENLTPRAPGRYAGIVNFCHVRGAR